MSCTKVVDYDFSIEVSVIDTIIDEEKRKSLENKVQSLMESLSGSQREAIYLRHIMEMEYDEIAKILNINAESVRKLVYRGIDRLREHPDLDVVMIIFLYFT